MYDFFSNSSYYKSFVVDNLLVAKLLHDRGFKVDGLDIGDAIFGSVLDILFGEDNITWDSIDPVLPDDAERILEKIEEGEELPEEETEAGCYISEYVNRDHYRIEVRINDLAELNDSLRPKNYRQMMEPLKGVGYSSNEHFNVDLCEEYFPWYELVEEIEWLRDKSGKIIGFWLHMIDVAQGTEEPVSDLRYTEAFIRFWDALQIIKKKVQNNACVSDNKNSKRRQRIRKPRGEGSNQGKTDRPGPPLGTGEEHAA